MDYFKFVGKIEKVYGVHSMQSRCPISSTQPTNAQYFS